MCIKVLASPVLGAAEQMSEPSLTCHSTQMALVTGRGHWGKNESAGYLLGAPWESPPLERRSLAGQRVVLFSAASVTPPRPTREVKLDIMVSCLTAGEAAFILPVVELGLKIRHLSRQVDGWWLSASSPSLQLVLESASQTWRAPSKTTAPTEDSDFFHLSLGECSFGSGVDVKKLNLYLLHYGRKPMI